MNLQMLFAGDLFPTDKNSKEFTDANVNMLLGDDLLEYWYSNDFRCFNLEGPLCDEGNPIKKNGVCLSACCGTINGIERLRPSLISLANNHIMDYGVEGINSTLSLLKDRNINYTGIGQTSNIARQSFITVLKGIRIGVYACVEHEFSEATEWQIGANVYEPLNVFDDVQNLSNNCDITVVLFHGGKEYYRYPTPELQRRCRKFIDKGASVVLCQHSHCIGCEEKYKDGFIVYGQGDFLFDHGDSEYRQTSVLVQIEFDIANRDIQVNYIPIVKYNQYVRFANNEDKNNILDEFDFRSRQICESGFVERNFKQFCSQKYNAYVAALLGRKKFWAMINKITKGKFMEKYYSLSGLLRLYNYIKCEAHREVLLEAIRGRIEGEK